MPPPRFGGMVWGEVGRGRLDVSFGERAADIVVNRDASFLHYSSPDEPTVDFGVLLIFTGHLFRLGQTFNFSSCVGESPCSTLEVEVHQKLSPHPSVTLPSCCISSSSSVESAANRFEFTDMSWWSGTIEIMDYGWQRNWVQLDWEDVWR